MRGIFGGQFEFDFVRVLRFGTEFQRLRIGIAVVAIADVWQIELAKR